MGKSRLGDHILVPKQGKAVFIWAGEIIGTIWPKPGLGVRKRAISLLPFYKVLNVCPKRNCTSTSEAHLVTINTW